jgi:hypothetical protein
MLWKNLWQDSPEVGLAGRDHDILVHPPCVSDAEMEMDGEKEEAVFLGTYLARGRTGLKPDYSMDSTLL